MSFWDQFSNAITAGFKASVEQHVFTDGTVVTCTLTRGDVSFSGFGKMPEGAVADAVAQFTNGTNDANDTSDLNDTDDLNNAGSSEGTNDKY